MPFDWYYPTPEQWADNREMCKWFLEQQQNNFEEYERVAMVLARRQFERDWEWAEMDKDNGNLTGVPHVCHNFRF